MLRGAAAGLLLFHVVQLLRPGPHRRVRLTLAAFTLSVLAYLFCSLPPEMAPVTPLRLPQLALCISSAPLLCTAVGFVGSAAAHPGRVVDAWLQRPRAHRAVRGQVLLHDRVDVGRAAEEHRRHASADRPAHHLRYAAREASALERRARLQPRRWAQLRSVAHPFLGEHSARRRLCDVLLPGASLAARRPGALPSGDCA